MTPLLLVMLGGALGAGARHLVGRATLAWWGAAFPYGTLTVNVAGGLLMGMLVGALSRTGVGEAWRRQKRCARLRRPIIASTASVATAMAIAICR